MRIMFSTLALVAAAAVAAAAPPPPPAPVLTFQGRDQVLIGRIYWREDGRTQPLARFGMVLGGKSASQTIAAASDESGSCTITFSARRAGEDAAQVSWSLQPGPGMKVAAGEGRLTVKEGSVGHVALGGSGGAELFGSLETGRASVFNLQRLWEHFGIMTDAQRFAPAASSVPSASSWSNVPAAPASPPLPRGGSISVTCASGRAFELSTGTGIGRCDLDVEGDRVTGGRCDDDAGNFARASCTLNENAGACLGTGGSGSCRQR